MKRTLYDELQPEGALGDFLFDRFWFCLLKLLLTARAENNVVPAKRSLKERVEEAGMLAMVGARAESDRDNSLVEIQNLLRYDSHYSREALRLIGIFLAFKTEGDSGAARMLYKRFVPAKDQDN